MEIFLGQLLALITFFGFPAFQYFIVKRFSRREANPELWYLPSYGFRLVIRNIPNKRVLSDIKSKSIIRNIIEANSGSSVSTFEEETLVEKEEFFLFPGSDQILISFMIIGDDISELIFRQTDKLGSKIKDFKLAEFESLISDYTANVENLLNFDIKVSKRVIINSKSIIEYWTSVNRNNIERRFICSEIINVG